MYQIWIFQSFFACPFFCELLVFFAGSRFENNFLSTGPCWVPPMFMRDGTLVHVQGTSCLTCAKVEIRSFMNITMFKAYVELRKGISGQIIAFQ